MKKRNLALRTPSSFSYEMLLKDDQSIEHVKVTRSNQVLSLPKNKHIGISASLANKAYVNWTACARPDCSWSLGGGSLWAAILTPLRACPIVAAIEPDLLLGRFAKIRCDDHQVQLIRMKGMS